MRQLLAAAAPALLLMVAGCTDAGDDPRIADTASWALTAAAPLGPPVDCIERGRVRSHAIRDTRTIDFELDDGSLLRNRLPFACPGLGQRPRLTYRTALPRLCSVDQITLLDAEGRAAGNCGLGSFQPVAIPARQGRLPRRG